MKEISCLVIEDEVPSQKIISDYIGRLPFLKLQGIYANPLQAIESLSDDDIDLVFLDIALPQMSGIDFLKSFKMRPRVIMTTGSDEFALESYEYEVLDYLLKPFSFERFLKAISRLSGVATLKSREQTTDNEVGHFLLVKDGKDYIKIISEDIRYIKAEKDYTKVICANESHLILKTMSQWESDLQGQPFIRIHRSYIINAKRLDRVGSARVKVDSESLPIGRNYRVSFKKALEKFYQLNLGESD